MQPTSHNLTSILVLPIMRHLQIFKLFRYFLFIFVLAPWPRGLSQFVLFGQLSCYNLVVHKVRYNGCEI
jgi:hypothetical protein